MNLILSQWTKLQEAITRSCSRSHHNPGNVQVVAVTKNRSLQEIQELYHLGQRHFGENRPQALLERIAEFPESYWHLIGPLQKNKVSKIVGKTYLIHSVDSLELGQKLAACGDFSLLLQVNLSGEATKQGLSAHDADVVYEQLLKFPQLKILGLMTMAPRFDGTNESEKSIRSTYSKTRELLVKLQKKYATPQFRELSMGMSKDFEWAIEEGATIIRVGSYLFNGPSTVEK